MHFPINDELGSTSHCITLSTLIPVLPQNYITDELVYDFLKNKYS
jgi:hypothetical protein